jgi:hypothetical protein
VELFTIFWPFARENKDYRMPITVGIAPAAKQIGAKRGVVSGGDTSNQIRLEMTSDSGLATWS